MKKTLIFLVLILIGGGWLTNKILQRSNKSSEEKERFTEQARNYSDDASIFLSEQVKHHHDEAFSAAYQMWKLSPVSEIDLSNHYDEKVYFIKLSELITAEAKKEGQIDAYTALLSIGEHYGVPSEGKIPSSKRKPTSSVSSPGPPPSKPDETRESSLKKPKLGDKRKIPSSRRRDDD